MSHRPNPLLLAPMAALLLACAGASAQAQTPVEAKTAPDDGKSNAKIERITHEDKLSRVDEVRVGGQTRSIEITPKNGAPAYEIAPTPGGADLSEGSSANGSSGKSRWRIFSF